ncbi:MAG: hypothetical protein ACE5FZ_02590 [Nitrospiria bacterium]
MKIVLGKRGEIIAPFQLGKVCIGFLMGFLLVSGGCGHVEPGEEGVAGGLDHNTFKSAIQPVMDNRGCTQNGCHFRDKANPNIGGPGGSLRLYICTVNDPCTPEELLANHDSSAGMSDIVNPSNSRLLTKPLALPGGIQHLGGEIFSSTTDPDYLAVLSWIQSPL